jgi:hypothetical protein
MVEFIGSTLLFAFLALTGRQSLDSQVVEIVPGIRCLVQHPRHEVESLPSMV